MAIYMAPVAEMQKMMAGMTPEKQKEEMGQWMEWMNAHQSAITDMGAPLGKTKRVTVSGVTDTKNDIGGYTVVQAESHEEAAQMFTNLTGHLKIPGASIEVMEIMPMPM